CSFPLKNDALTRRCDGATLIQIKIKVSVPPVSGQGEEKLERPLVENRSITSCGSNFNSYLCSSGHVCVCVCVCVCCFVIVPHHSQPFCLCNSPKLSTGYPLQEEQIVTIIICVILLIIGLAGALYFCCSFRHSRSRRVTEESRRVKPSCCICCWIPSGFLR
uniref:Proepiregulin-like n=1 Tax=Kryptolebias marmoratus TaxID=37003 RepID=A0A3Q2ZUA3_KRYMA